MIEDTSKPSTDSGDVKESVDDLKRKLETVFEEAFGQRSDLASNLRLIKTFLERNVEPGKIEISENSLKEVIKGVVEAKTASSSPEEINLQAMVARRVLQKQEKEEESKALEEDPKLKELRTLSEKGADLEELQEQKSKAKALTRESKELAAKIDQAKQIRKKYFEEYDKYVKEQVELLGRSKKEITQEEYDEVLQKKQKERADQVLKELREKRTQTEKTKEETTGDKKPATGEATVVGATESAAGVPKPSKSTPILLGGFTSALDAIATKSLLNNAERPSLQVSIIDIDKDIFKRLQATFTASLLEAQDIMGKTGEGTGGDGGDTTIIDGNGRRGGRPSKPQTPKGPVSRPGRFGRFGRLVLPSALLKIGGLSILQGGSDAYQEYQDTKEKATTETDPNKKELLEQQASGRALGAGLQGTLAAAAGIIAAGILVAPTGPLAPAIGTAVAFGVGYTLNALAGNTGAELTKNAFVNQSLKDKIVKEATTPEQAAVVSQTAAAEIARKEQAERETAARALVVPDPLKQAKEQQKGGSDSTNSSKTVTPGKPLTNMNVMPDKQDNTALALKEGFESFAQEYQKMNVALLAKIQPEKSNNTTQVTSVQTNKQDSIVNNFPLLAGVLAHRETYNFVTGAKSIA